MCGKCLMKKVLLFLQLAWPMMLATSLPFCLRDINAFLSRCEAKWMVNIYVPPCNKKIRIFSSLDSRNNFSRSIGFRNVGNKNDEVYEFYLRRDKDACGRVEPSACVQGHSVVLDNLLTSSQVKISNLFTCYRVGRQSSSNALSLPSFALYCFYSSNSNDILEGACFPIHEFDYSLPVIGSVPVRIEVDAHWLRQTGAEPGIFSQKLVPV